MNINCSENCIYEENGNCTLTHITTYSGKSKNNCPYYKEKSDNIKSGIEGPKYNT